MRLYVKKKDIPEFIGKIIDEMEDVWTDADTAEDSKEKVHIYGDIYDDIKNRIYDTFIGEHKKNGNFLIEEILPVDIERCVEKLIDLFTEVRNEVADLIVDDVEFYPVDFYNLENQLRELLHEHIVY